MKFSIVIFPQEQFLSLPFHLTTPLNLNDPNQKSSLWTIFIETSMSHWVMLFSDHCCMWEVSSWKCIQNMNIHLKFQWILFESKKWGRREVGSRKILCYCVNIYSVFIMEHEDTHAHGNISKEHQKEFSHINKWFQCKNETPSL